MNLSRTDERTKAALKRLAMDGDFQEFTAWLEYSLAELDSRQRNQLDGVLMRQGQGATQVIAEILDAVNGKSKAITIARVTSRTG